MGALAAARRADRLRVNAHVGGPGARDGVRGAWASQRVPGAVLQRTSAPIDDEPARTGLCRTEDCGSDGDS